MELQRIEVAQPSKQEIIEYATNIAKNHCSVAIKNAKYLGGGSFGRAVRIDFVDGNKIVIKFLLVKGMLEKEVNDLQLLGRYCTAKMPNVLFAKEKDNDIPIDYYAMELIEGKPMIYDFILYLKSKKKRLQVSEQIVQALHSIHMCIGNKFGDTINPIYDDWLDYYRPFAEDVYNKAKAMQKEGKLSQKIIDVMTKALQKFDLIFEEKVEKACLIHGDLNVVNIMVDKQHNLSGFIDPLNSMYADYEYDLFQFYNLTGKRFFLGELYKEKYGASKHFYDKMAFYGLWNEVYCYIKSGVYVGFIMNPLVKNMQKRLENL